MNTIVKQQHSNQTSDDIDLFTLFENIWQQKKLVAVIMLISLICGITYAFLSTPVYKASINLKQPNSATIRQLSLLALYPELTNESPLRELLSTLEDTSFQQKFINTANDTMKTNLYPGTLEMQLKSYSDRSDVIASDAKKENSLFPYKVTFTAPSGSAAADELNRLIELASHHLTKEFQTRYTQTASIEINKLSQRIKLLEDKLAEERSDKITRLQEERKLKLQQLNDQLAAYKQAYRSTLKDRIHSLEEAHSIAAALNINEPVELNQLTKKPSARIEVLADISSQKDPLYLRGTRLLGKELEQLKSRADDYFPDKTVRELETKIALMQYNRQIEILSARNSDHPFSSDIQTLKARIHTIQSEPFPEEFQLNFIASKSIAEPSPIKPKKALIIALSIILGGMLGLMAALVRGAFLRKQEAKAVNGV